MTATVIVVTLNRPDYVRKCLNCLDAQTRRPEQVIVVDASKDDLTQAVVSEFPHVLYLRNENGFGQMTKSRNIGLRKASGDVICFIDDDSFAHPAWLEKLLPTFDEPVIGVVGGRALNGLPGEAEQGKNEIGLLKRNGALTGNFAADSGTIVEVDHVMGCNMSYRRSVLASLGGFREDCSGISGVREDSDMCMRVKRLGYRIVFNPAAVVDHVGAPQAVGRRFDARYVYYNHRNHLILMIRNFGLFQPILGRNLLHTSGVAIRECARVVGGALWRFSAAVAGTISGLALGTFLRLRSGSDPVRRDEAGAELTHLLTRHHAAPIPQSSAVNADAAVELDAVEAR